MTILPRTTPEFSPNLVAWCCQNCGRYEAPSDQRSCPDCGEKMQRCSRYEWFLADALTAELLKRGRSFRLDEQWSFYDHRGFCWYFDLRVWVDGPNRGDGCKPSGGAGLLIEVDGATHARQKKYKGPGGGYTRDYDKKYEYDKTTPRGSWLDQKHIPNEECARKGGAVHRTAERLADDICHEADHTHASH